MRVYEELGVNCPEGVFIVRGVFIAEGVENIGPPSCGFGAVAGDCTWFDP
jgi:hypothetical protein